MSTATMSTETLTHPTPYMSNTPVLPQTIKPTPLIQSQPQQPKLSFTTNRYRLRCTAH